MSGLEIEAKLVAPSADQLLAFPQHLAALGMTCAEPERMIARDHYLDTADLHLYRAGWALRLRDLGVRKLLTMKALKPAGADGVSAREEREQAIEWSGGDAPSFPAEVLDGRLHALLGERPLRRLFFLRQDRLQCHAGGEPDGPYAGLWVEVSMDLVRWEGQELYTEGFEAELELRGGEPEQLRTLSHAVAEATGWPAASGSKFERGLRVAGLL